MSVPSFAGITKINLEKSAKMWVLKQFHAILGPICPEKVKNYNFRPLKWLPFPWGQGHLKSNSWIRCPLPLAMSLQSFVEITKTDFEESANMGPIKFRHTTKIYQNKWITGEGLGWGLPRSEILAKNKRKWCILVSYKTVNYHNNKQKHTEI